MTGQTAEKSGIIVSLQKIARVPESAFKNTHISQVKGRKVFTFAVICSNNEWHGFYAQEESCFIPFPSTIRRKLPEKVFIKSEVNENVW